MDSQKEREIDNLVYNAQREYMQKTLFDELQITYIQKQILNESDEGEKLKQSLGTWYEDVLNDINSQEYRPLKCVGQGSFGKVVIAAFPSYLQSIRVAIKIIPICSDNSNVINENLLELCNKEVDLLKKVNDSDHVVRYQNHFQSEKYFYIVMEECLGTLEDILKMSPNKKMNENTFLKYSLEIAKGIDYIQKEGIVLRDIKPENILIGHDYKAKISDFGLAGQIQTEQSFLLSSNKGNVLFSSPEANIENLKETFLQKMTIKGNMTNQKNLPVGQQSKKSDIYALGMLFMYILGYQNAINIIQKLSGLKDNDFPDISQFKSQGIIKHIILQMTDFLPEDRANIEETISILNQISFDLSNLKLKELINPTYKESRCLQYVQVGNQIALTSSAERVIKEEFIHKYQLKSKTQIEGQINFISGLINLNNIDFDNSGKLRLEQIQQNIQEGVSRLEDEVIKFTNSGSKKRADQLLSMKTMIERFSKQQLNQSDQEIMVINEDEADYFSFRDKHLSNYYLNLTMKSNEKNLNTIYLSLLQQEQNFFISKNISNLKELGQYYTQTQNNMEEEKNQLRENAKNYIRIGQKNEAVKYIKIIQYIELLQDRFTNQVMVYLKLSANS